MSELKERLDNLRALMQEPEFLEGKGLSNEVNIRIFCYDPSDEMMVRHFIEQIMTDQSMNCHLIEHNLYEVFLSICEDKRIAKTIPAMEEKKGKEFIRDQMSRMANNTAFVNKMKYEPHDYQVYASEYIKEHDAAAVFLECGLGKTSITLTAICDLMFDSFEIHKVLIIGPDQSRNHELAG